VTWPEHGPDQSLSLRQQQQTRVAQQHAFEQQLLAVCRPYVGTHKPQNTFCERVERFLPELFVFVAVSGIPAHNNLAERSVRPLVIARKISGGNPQSERLRDPYGTRQSLWHLATLTLKSSLGQR
jgi:transposase